MAKVGVIMVDNMVVVGDIEIGDEEAHELFGIGREMPGPYGPGIGRFAPGGHPWSRHHGSRHRARGGHGGDHEGRRGPRRGLGSHRDDDDDEGRDHGPPHDPARPLTHPRIKAREEAKAKEPEDEEAKAYGGAQKEEAEDPEAKAYGGTSEKKEESGTVVRGAAARRSKERAHHRAELDNDEGAEQLARLTTAENPGEELAQLEAAGNRANARGRGSVREEMANPSYYPSSSRNRGARAEITEENMERAREAIKQYLGGSNLLDYGTGNESPGSANIRNAGTVTYVARPNEYYGVEPADIEWANRQRRLDEGAAEETERLPGSRGKSELPPLIPGQAEHRSRMPHPAPAPSTPGAGGATFPSESEFETGGYPNLERVNPELIRRTNAAYEAAKAAGVRFTVVSGWRPATRREAREAGMSESSSQEDIWERSKGGRLFMAAPPGRSRHQSGEALDVRDPSGWLHENAERFGLEFPVRGDYPHMQMIPDWERERARN